MTPVTHTHKKHLSRNESPKPTQVREHRNQKCQQLHPPYQPSHSIKPLTTIKPNAVDSVPPSLLLPAALTQLPSPNAPHTIMPSSNALSNHQYDQHNQHNQKFDGFRNGSSKQKMMVATQRKKSPNGILKGCRMSANRVRYQEYTDTISGGSC